MSKLSDKDKVEIGIIVIILILAAYYEFIINPILSINSNMNTKITALNDQYNQMDILKNENIQLKTKITSLKQKYKISSNGIPSNIKDADIQNSIATICSNNNTILSSLTFSDSSLYAYKGNKNQNIRTNTNALMKLPVIIIITGSYSNITKTMSAIEKETRIFKITDFTLSNGDNKLQNNNNSALGTVTTLAKGISATINGNYCFFNGDTKPKYDFNLGSYGKSDLFN